MALSAFFRVLEYDLHLFIDGADVTYARELKIPVEDAPVEDIGFTLNIPTLYARAMYEWIAVLLHIPQATQIASSGDLPNNVQIPLEGWKIRVGARSTHSDLFKGAALDSAQTFSKSRWLNTHAPTFFSNHDLFRVTRFKTTFADGDMSHIIFTADMTVVDVHKLEDLVRNWRLNHIDTAWTDAKASSKLDEAVGVAGAAADKAAAIAAVNTPLATAQASLSVLQSATSSDGDVQAALPNVVAKATALIEPLETIGTVLTALSTDLNDDLFMLSGTIPWNYFSEIETSVSQLSSRDASIGSTVATFLEDVTNLYAAVGDALLAIFSSAISKLASDSSDILALAKLVKAATDLTSVKVKTAALTLENMPLWHARTIVVSLANGFLAVGTPDGSDTYAPFKAVATRAVDLMRSFVYKPDYATAHLQAVFGDVVEQTLFYSSFYSDERYCWIASSTLLADLDSLQADIDAASTSLPEDTDAAANATKLLEAATLIAASLRALAATTQHFASFATLLSGEIRVEHLGFYAKTGTALVGHEIKGDQYNLSHLLTLQADYG